MPDRQWRFATVEILHFAGLHLGCADRQTRRSFVQLDRIGQFLERALERLCRVITGTLRAQRNQAERRQRIGLEESAKAGRDRHHVCGQRPDQGHSRSELRQPRMRHPAPEFFKARQASLRRIAGNEAGIDGSDRGADHPVRFNAGLAEGLVDADLISTERPAALEHENDLPEGCAIEFHRIRHGCVLGCVLGGPTSGSFRNVPRSTASTEPRGFRLPSRSGHRVRPKPRLTDRPAARKYKDNIISIRGSYRRIPADRDRSPATAAGRPCSRRTRWHNHLTRG